MDLEELLVHSSKEIDIFLVLIQIELGPFSFPFKQILLTTRDIISFGKVAIIGNSVFWNNAKGIHGANT